MSVARHHAEWMSLVESSGPFLSMPVLLRIFPQGLDPRDSAKASKLRDAYEDWLDRGAKRPDVHYAWIRHVLTDLLEYPPEFLVEGQVIPPGMEATMPNFGETLRPTFVLKHRDSDKKPTLFIEHYPPGQDLEKPVSGKVWKASPGTRMMELLHAADVPLGLITNGEQWMLIFAPRGETTGFASWFADIWMQEPITLRAFHSLLHLRRFLGVAEPETLAAMFDESSKDQQEVTDQLGYQVRQAVEMLVQAFDRIDAESGRTLLAGVAEKALYDSALTVMMRLVFLFSADERGLLLLGDPLYDQHYAVSTLSLLLRERADQQGEEILQFRHDAWCRLLATFRAVHGGVQHEAMRLPAYGGTLFDPDRYPFLEGRSAGTRWHVTPAKPLPINNRVVLHLLEALQVLRVKVPGGGPAEARRLSFRALDIEQIGHVYEGLLDHTAKRAGETILGLAGAKNNEPEIPLSKLEEIAAKGTPTLVEFLKEKTSRSDKALKRLIEEPPILEEHALLIACGQDPRLVKRVKPFAALLRADSFDKPVVIPEGSVFVTAGTDRRSSGTHYTPRSLTEPIVQYTLEPLVYIGPAEGVPRDQWILCPPTDLLDLKICDMACGSGAFLVQACRYLSERLVEAWERAERNLPRPTNSKLPFPTITPEGKPSTGEPGETLIPRDTYERLVLARRVVAQRCFYGVDINPLACEMAKLSLWLLTLAKDKPFTFLDHAIRSGDSLVGITSLTQLETFSLDGKADVIADLLKPIKRRILAAVLQRKELERLPNDSIADVFIKQQKHDAAEEQIARLRCAADWLLAGEWESLVLGSRKKEPRKQALMDATLSLSEQSLDALKLEASTRLLQNNIRSRFHWALEFPEVFVDRGGFDAFVCNPPFMGGQKITGNLGDEYREYLVAHLGKGKRGSADLCAYFFLRAAHMLRPAGQLGFLATNTIAQGDTREVGLDQLTNEGYVIPRAVASRPWPGTASLEVAHVWLRRGTWSGEYSLNDHVTTFITALLTSAETITGMPHCLAANRGKSFQGTTVLGLGFVLSPEEASSLIARDERNRNVLRPYLNGEDLNSLPDGIARRWVINFQDWPLDRTAKGSWRNSSEQERSEWRRQGIVPSDYPEAVAADFPLCMQIVEQRVRPERAQNNDKRRREIWWQFTRPTLDLYDTVRGCPRVLVACRVTKYLVHAVLPPDYVFDVATNVILYTDDAYCVANSNIFDSWVREYASSLKDFVRYTVTDGFETFPFPPSLPTAPHLASDHEQTRRSSMLARRRRPD